MQISFRAIPNRLVPLLLCAGVVFGSGFAEEALAARGRARAIRRAAALRPARRTASARRAAAPRAAAQRAAAQKAGAAKAAAQRAATARKSAAARQAAIKAGRVASELPVGRLAPLETLFRTAADYDARLDLKPSFVVLDRRGEGWDTIERGIRSWKAAGYPVHRLLDAGRDTGGHYSGGKADGVLHPEELDLGSDGTPVQVSGNPAVVPTAGWIAYLKGQVRRSIDADVQALWPAGLGLPAAGGYSAFFKTAWQEEYRAVWKAPREGPAQFFPASRLRSDLTLKLLDELQRYTRDYARQKGKTCRLFVPLEAPVASAERGVVLPAFALSRLPVDGIVAHLRAPSPSDGILYEGRPDVPYFESAWIQLSYFANLIDGVPDRPLYFLPDSGGQDGLEKPEAAKWWRAALAASLLAPQARGYEAAARPERLLLPGPAGVPGPSPSPRVLEAVSSALAELPAQASLEWNGGTRGIGILTLDTMTWQRGGPRGASMRSFYGLALPLLKRGVPVQIVPGERAADRAFLSRFRVLLLSFDMQKPLGPEVSEAIAEWVRTGGTLILMGGEDAYNGVPEWWARAGHSSPTEHLLKTCAVQVDLGGRTVLNGADRFREALRSPLPSAGAPVEKKVYSLPVAPYAVEGKSFYLRLTDADGEAGGGAWLGRVRVVQAKRARADFTAGSVGETPFLVEAPGSVTGRPGRTVDGDAALVYRFARLPADATLELELGGEFRVAAAAGEDPGVALQPAVELPPGTLAPVRAATVHPLVQYPLAGAQALFRVPGPAAGLDAEKVPAWWSASGAGFVVYCGLPAAFGAGSTAGADLVRNLVRFACAKEGLAYLEGPIVARRGPYVIAHSLGRAADLKGRFLDLLHEDLPLSANPPLPYREPAVLKEVSFNSRAPALLHASHRCVVLEANAVRMRLALAGPAGQEGRLRIYLAGMAVGEVTAVDAAGRTVAVEARAQGPTLQVRYPQVAAGFQLAIRWLRPEARLTR